MSTKKFAQCYQTDCYFNAREFCQINADPRNGTLEFLTKVIAECLEIQFKEDTFETLKAECVKAYDAMYDQEKEEAYKVAYMLTFHPKLITDSGDEIFHRFSDLTN